ncbi:MAG: cation-translocating P-type ATPase, partial [Anaerolineae bacterium]|nr:cation-translocating P-type ATPase [Anaerolineae bacterium]
GVINGKPFWLGSHRYLEQRGQETPEVHEQLESMTEAGRTVVVVGSDEHVCGFITLADVIRDESRDAIRELHEAGVEQLVMLTGDNEGTAKAIAKEAGIDEVHAELLPEDKVVAVERLVKQYEHVAMIGDGVNDVLSLKKANLGIAMESGSAATRGVADMILIGDSFNALPAAFSEGQRIVNGRKDILRLFLTRVTYAAILIIAIDLIGLGFPFIPKQNSLLVGIGVGLPTLGLAVWARPGPVPKHGMLREIARFVVPAALSISFFGVIVYALAFTVGVIDVLGISVTSETVASFEEYIGIDYTLTTISAYQAEVAHLVAQTALTAFTVFASLILVVFVEPPTQFFVAGDEFSGDWRPTLLAIGLFVVYMVIVLVEPLRTFFEMIDLPILAYVAIAAIALIWMLLLRMAWRHNWLERFLQVERLGD